MRGLHVALQLGDLRRELILFLNEHHREIVLIRLHCGVELAFGLGHVRGRGLEALVELLVVPAVLA